MADKVVKLAPKKKRKRGRSLDAQIKAKAKEIYASGMADAMKAATGQLVLQKLAELQSLLAATGYRIDNASAIPPAGPAHPVQPAPPPRPVIEHPCTQCGRESVYRSKPHRFNPKGSWYCRDHAGLGVGSDADDQLDKMLLGAPQGPVVQQAAPVVPAAPPVQMIKESAPPPAQPDALMAAMGMAEMAE